MISLLHAQLVLPRYSTISEVSQFHDRECHRANYLLASFILNHLDVTEVFTNISHNYFLKSMDKTVISTQCEFVHSNKVKIMYVDHSTVILLQLQTIINFNTAVSDVLQTLTADNQS